MSLALKVLVSALAFIVCAHKIDAYPQPNDCGCNEIPYNVEIPAPKTNYVPVYYNAPQPPPPPSPYTSQFASSAYSSASQLEPNYSAPEPVYNPALPALAYSAPAPVYSSPAPAPAYSAPAPIYSSPPPAPAYSAPAPVYSSPPPAPAYSASAPVYSSPPQAPAYSASAPVYSSPPQAEPIYSAPAPVYSPLPPASIYSAPASAYSSPPQPQPDYSSYYQSASAPAYSPPPQAPGFNPLASYPAPVVVFGAPAPPKKPLKTKIDRYYIPSRGCQIQDDSSDCDCEKY